MSRTDEELVRDALDHIEILKSHLAKAGVDDAVVADAVNMRLAATIESLAQTSEAFRRNHFGDEWQLMKATRNRISHGYSFVSQDIIFMTIANRLPGLEATLRAALVEGFSREGDL